MGCNSSKTTSTTTGPAKQNNDAEHTNGDAGTTDQQNNTDTKAAEQGEWLKTQEVMPRINKQKSKVLKLGVRSL